MAGQRGAIAADEEPEAVRQSSLEDSHRDERDA